MTRGDQWRAYIRIPAPTKYGCQRGKSNGTEHELTYAHSRKRRPPVIAPPKGQPLDTEELIAKVKSLEHRIVQMKRSKEKE